MKRLFIEISDEDKSKLSTQSCMASDMHGVEMTENFFDTVITNANKNKKEILEALQTHDEIYAFTALIPQGYETSGYLFNGLMKFAIDNKITGKSVFLLRKFKDIFWTELDEKLLNKCFVKNYLYFEGDDFEKWHQVDIDRLLKDKFR